MNMNLKAECVVIVPQGTVTAVLLVNPDGPVGVAVADTLAWQDLDSVTLTDTDRLGRTQTHTINNAWFIDAVKCDSTANVLMIRLMQRSDLRVTPQVQT